MKMHGAVLFFFAAAWQNKDVYNIVVSSSYNSVMQTKI